MTSQPDTAAIRAEVEQWGEALTGDWVWALCDALDAARADTAEADRVWRMWKSRAEATEAQLATERKANAIAEGQWAERCYASEARIADLQNWVLLYEGRFTRAEARIAVALDICNGNYEGYQVDCIHRALTEGTGQ